MEEIAAAAAANAGDSIIKWLDNVENDLGESVTSHHLEAP